MIRPQSRHRACLAWLLYHEEEIDFGMRRRFCVMAHTCAQWSFNCVMQSTGGVNSCNVARIMAVHLPVWCCVTSEPQID
jgi:hypothetical protein